MQNKDDGANEILEIRCKDEVLRFFFVESCETTKHKEKNE